MAHFKTNVLLKNIVGKDLINDDNIAVLELVKNSYDAGANKVELHFRNMIPTRSGKPRSTKHVEGQSKDEGEPQILIVDNGSGMTRKDIIEKWLNIAYSEKKYEQKKGKRILAGNKGVGRFSCDRLGRDLNLYTRTHGGELVHLFIDWRQFEVENKPNLEIQTIPVSLDKLELDEVRKNTKLFHWTKGTILHITGLRSFWGIDALVSLRSYLERLFNPNQPFEKEKFTLEIIAPNFEDYDAAADTHERINGEIRNEIFERLNFKTTNIESTIDDRGEFITTVLTHDGKEVYQVVERNEFEHLKSVKVVIYYLNPYKKTYFRKQTGLDPVQFGSIFLFINGFRVPPYGDRANDWLGLDVRKSQGMARYIATRDLVGRIEINDLENRFQIVSSREGLIKNEASDQLRPFYYKAHLRLESFVVDGLHWDSVPDYVKKQLRSADGKFKWSERTEEYKETQSEKSSRIAENLISVLDAKPEQVVSINVAGDLLEQVASQNRQTVEEILTHFDKYDRNIISPRLSTALKNLRQVVERQDRELEKLRGRVADQESEIEDLRGEVATRESEALFLKSVSTLDQDNLLSLLHQVGLDSATIKNFVERLLNRLAKGEKLTDEFLANSLERISYANKKILAISQFATKANFKFQSQPIEADLIAFIEQYLLNVAKDYVASNLKVRVNRHDSEPFRIRLRPIEVTIVFDNLLSNSKKAGAKEVIVDMKRASEDVLEIVVKDNGRGFAPGVKNIDSIFRKGFTTTTGSGLGLYHVAEILKSMHGTILAAPANGNGAQFLIRIKK